VSLNSEEQAILERARAEIPRDKRQQRYGHRDMEKWRDDLNHNWDLTRALLHQIDDLRARLRWATMQKLLLAGILGGAAAKGLEVAFLAAVKFYMR
jgi:hypothetical protein